MRKNFFNKIVLIIYFSNIYVHILIDEVKFMF